MSHALLWFFVYIAGHLLDRKQGRLRRAGKSRQAGVVYCHDVVLSFLIT